jgi:hypothetical protein
MLSNDVELNGVEYNVVPGQYKKLLRKRQSPSKPAARRIGRTGLRWSRGRAVPERDRLR